MIFRYTSNSGSFNGDNQALGAVIMSTEYDITDPLPLDRIQMENMEYTCSAKPSTEQIEHGIECDPHQTTVGGLFFTGVPDDSSNIEAYRMYDLATFYIASTGVLAAGGNPLLGVLSVEFDIEFLKLQQPDLSSTYLSMFTPSFPQLGPGLAQTTSTIVSNTIAAVGIIPSVGANGIYMNLPAGTYATFAIVQGTGMVPGGAPVVTLYDSNGDTVPEASDLYSYNPASTTTTKAKFRVFSTHYPVESLYISGYETGASTARFAIFPFTREALANLT
jgi:hypothetical protein